jgi:hypothetical protein
MHRHEGQRWIGPGGVARLGLALLAGACSPTLDPLSERCVQALEYREPDHGDIEAAESYRSPSGAGVAIRYVEETDSGLALPQMITCEFEVGERWRFTRINLRGRELSEAELALVNAEFLLRDLDRHPERFSSAPPPGPAPPGSEVGDGPAPPPRPPWQLSWPESLPPLEWPGDWAAILRPVDPYL